MKVFVTGATGFVGQEILRQFKRAGHTTRILARQPESRVVRALVPDYCQEVHAGDVTESCSLAGALRDMDAIIHLVGIISEVGPITFENVHLRGTENMVRAARAQKVGRFVHMSALGTRPAAVARYHRSKWAAEEAVRNSGLEFTIFRPSLIYGPQDHFVNLFANIIRLSPIVPVLGRKDALFQPVAVEAVAAAFVKCLSQASAAGKTFDLCGRERFSMRGVLDVITAVMGKRRLKLPIPTMIARFQAALLEFACGKILSRRPPLNRDQLLMLEEDNIGDPDPAATAFGLPLAPFREGIQRFLKKPADSKHRLET